MSRQSLLNNTPGASKKNATPDAAVVVAVRIRPPNEKERNAAMTAVFQASEDAQSVMEIGDNDMVTKSWPYDYVFGPQCDNAFVFQSVGQQLIDSALDGYNTVLFMYGQTSSGKTFTLFGGAGVAGLVDHSMRSVYEGVMKSTEMEYVIKMTFIELYNEEIKDLLTSEPSDNLRITEDAVLGPIIQNITEVNFTSVEDARRLLDEGDARRHFGVTNMNAHSSRSHVLVRLNIESRKVASQPANPLRQNWGKDKPTCFSTLNLVDLAGSERANKSGTSGQSLKEGSFINRSLLTLGTVISSLTEGRAGQHVPYRDSKLTRLLATALGGNAKTCMITCISPASGNLQESLSTLRFASRAKRIVNNVRKNEFDDAKSLALKLAAQKQEIDALREQLEQSKMGMGEGELKDKFLSANRKLRNLRFLVKNSHKVIKALNHAGKPNLAKRVREDVRDAIQGVRDLDEVIEEHCELLASHLAKEERLLRHMTSLQRANTMAGEEFDDFDLSSDSEDESADIFAGNFKSDEVNEELESWKLRVEDVISTYERKMSLLKDTLKDLVSSEKEARKLCDEYSGRIGETSIEIKALKASETSLKQENHRLQTQLDEEKKATSSSLDNATKINNTLEFSVVQKDCEINELRREIASRDSDLERLRFANDQLSLDLKSANEQRQAFEREAQRTRNELTTQMDRLRSNMHSMLQQGGETTKVLEMQNHLLHSQVSQLHDENENLKKNKIAAEQELKLLRRELQLLVEDSKMKNGEVSLVHSQVTSIQQTLQSLRVELSQVQSKYDASEQDNQSLRDKARQDEKTLIEVYENKLATLKSDLAMEKSKHDATEVEVSTLKVECESLRKRIEDKQTSFIKLEQQMHADISRLEKKLSSQARQLEDVLSEKMSLQNSYKTSIKSLTAANKELSHKINELESWNSAVKRFFSENNINGTDDSDENIYTDNFDDYSESECDDNQDGYTNADEIPNDHTMQVSSTNKTRAIKCGFSPEKDVMSLFPDIIEASSKYQFIKLALKSQQQNILYVSQLCHALYCTSSVLISDWKDKHHAISIDHMSLKSEIDHVLCMRNRMQQDIEDVLLREHDLSEQIECLKLKLFEKEEQCRRAVTNEECVVMKCRQLDLEKSAAKSLLEKVKCDIDGLRNENERMKIIISDLDGEIEQYAERNIILNNELDKALHELHVANAERDELMKQFIDNVRMRDNRKTWMMDGDDIR